MRAVQRGISDTEHAEVNVAIALLELAFRAEACALVMTDDHGTFVYYRPGQEVAIARFMASVNWLQAIRLAEEFSE